MNNIAVLADGEIQVGWCMTGRQYDVAGHWRKSCGMVGGGGVREVG